MQSDCEILLQPGTSSRGAKMLAAMAGSAALAGWTVKVTREWEAAAPVLMSYGLGHVGRRAAIEKHKRKGGRVVGWDLGYWGRDVPMAFNMRLTIDDDHPHKRIRSMPPERFDNAGIRLRELGNKGGPIVLCGLGKKQRTHKGYAGQSWEHTKLAAIRHRYPGRQVVYRPKRRDWGIPGIRLAPSGDIVHAINGASLVVCSQSNVAVDACIAGVPVWCDDGAALALYRDKPAPTREERLEFLRSLAWWQWSCPEAVAAWHFIRGELDA